MVYCGPHVWDTGDVPIYGRPGERNRIRLQYVCLMPCVGYFLKKNPKNNSKMENGERKSLNQIYGALCSDKS